MSQSAYPWRILGLAALALSGCVAAPRYPISEGPPGGGFGVAKPHYDVRPPDAPPPAAPTAPPPAAPAADDDAPRALPSRPVETTALPPAGAAPHGAPQGAPLAEAAPQRATPQREGGLSLQEWSQPAEPLPEGAREVQVQPFETLYDVAERIHAPIRALIALNDLKPPYALAAGTRLRVPAPVVYTVLEGDTLFGVARRFSVDPRALASLNGFDLEDRLRAGQTLSLPPGVADHGALAGARGQRPGALPAGTRTLEARAAEPAHEPRGPTPGTHPSEAASPHTPAPGDSEVAALGRGRFRWPLRGEILSSFGPKGPGQRNDGVNIAADPGASVKAAASGVVVYAGNSIPAFGNLVLVKHPGGWATLYGNLGKITVANNTEVLQGQEIGAAGISGQVDRAQVHFEIRYAADPRDKAKPFDPLILLPPG